MKEEKVILDTQEGLVEYRTNIEGWTGPDGLYYGKDDLGKRRAIYANCTHKNCECGNIIEKTRSRCGDCSSKSTEGNFLKMEEVEWDMESMIAVYDGDEFFSDMDEAYEYCESNDIDIEDLKLVICVSENRINEVDIDELNEDYHSEHKCLTELHPDIAKKVDELNELIRNTKPVLWFPTNKRIKIEK